MSEKRVSLNTDDTCAGARWLLVGAYVGFATVGAFCVWYMYDSFLGLDLSADGHSTVTWHQLRNWEQCRTWPDFKVGPCCSPLVPHSSRAAGFRTEVAFALRWSTIIVLLLQLCVRIRTL